MWRLLREFRRSQLLDKVSVVQAGHVVLRQAAAPVDPRAIASEEIQAIVGKMHKILDDTEHHGLSAPQIGVALQIMIVQITARQLKDLGKRTVSALQMTELRRRVFINPKLSIIDSSVVIEREGCLSVFGHSACVPRAREVCVSGLDENGEQVQLRARGWAARIVQHEIDHLQGLLFVDKMKSRTFANDHWIDRR
ncbi:peptide deformylase, mitochondrial-like [Corticium candelabrum]|uniref:peptide deformylase, mitochondrial-like n=1 Tax=Corticium candelabrum TaxID=121492 RepID=UPI002E252BE1|nr:peptide deformylase, mitochondrial-like [Corticium candelabrum]